MNKLRKPPHSETAEQGLLGALLTDNRVFDRVSDTVEAEDFYFADHRAIYSTICRLVMANRPADVLTVHDAGGHDMAYLNGLQSGLFTERHARQYATIVREAALRRRLIQLAAGLADDAYGDQQGTDVPTLVDNAITALLGLSGASTTTEPVDIAELAMRFIDELSERAAGTKVDTIATGLADMDELFGGGGRRGELWVIGARPSMGKTALTLTVSRNVAANHQALMLTQEDSLQALTSRHVAAAGRVNLADIRNPQRAPDSMWGGVTEGVEIVGRLMLRMDDQAALSLMDVRRKIQQVKRRCGKCDLVVIDYLQLMDGEGDNRNQALGQLANGLKRAAKELDCWIILLSQLNRKVDERNGPPVMSDLRDSGDIEGAADVIGLLHREFMRNRTEDNKHHAELHVVKHKNGPTGVIHLHFDGSVQRFENWAGPVPSRGAGGGKRAAAGRALN